MPPKQWRPAQVRPEDIRAQLRKWKTDVPVAVVAWGAHRESYVAGGQHTYQFVVVRRTLVVMFRGCNLVEQYVNNMRAEETASRDGMSSFYTTW